MSSRLPERIDPERLVQQGRVLRGRFELAQMARVSALLADENGIVEFELVFGRDAQNRPVMQSHVSADLRLTCQRCLEPMAVEIAADVDVAIATGDATPAQLETEHETVLADSPLRLADRVDNPAYPG